MTEKRIQFNTIVNNQLPQYVREEFPLVAEFLKQYYVSQEFQGASTDLIQNIDQYLKLDEIKSNSSSTSLVSDIKFLDEEIFVSSTIGFPDSYGLISINDEIITYTGKTQNSFIGCLRGFSGIKSYSTEDSTDELVFATTESANHSEGSIVTNLSSLFLKEFLHKLKYQLTPGFEDRELYSELDEYLYVKQAKDFYSTRGTDLSFKILFKVLYGEEVSIIKPQDYLIRPSTALYDSSKKLVVELISGNIFQIINSTLIQKPYGEVSGGYAPITKVERIFSDSNSNKEYYRLSIDSGYSRDISVSGVLYGNFETHQKTKIIGQVLSGTTTLDVDSTVGFPNSGELSVTYSDGSEGTVSYTSKSINQFFGCENITQTILDGSDIWINAYASNYDETVKVRITSVLTDVDIIDDTYFYNENDSGLIRTLGVEPNDVLSNNWFINNSVLYDVESIDLIAGDKYSISTKTNHNFKISDSIEISYSDGTKLNSKVLDITGSNRITVGEQGQINTIITKSVKKILTKVKSDNYSYLANQQSDVQNVYKIDDRTLVASPSLPYYGDTKINPYDRSQIIPSGTYVGDTFVIGNHNFYTGDSVYYIPSSSPSLFEEGVYFIARVNSSNGEITNSGASKSVKFSKSRESLFRAINNDRLYQTLEDKLKNSQFIKLSSEVQISSTHKIIDYRFYNKEITSQKIFREISSPINDSLDYETKFGTTGILINGVEVVNYKAKDKIYYGDVEEINIINGGSQYDIINPPILNISDSVGYGATGFCNIKGTLKEIRIIDSGFDYLESPIINITGGNGSSAKAKPSMKLVDHEVFFNSELRSELVNISDNTIGFTTYHKFRNAERVVYKTSNQNAIGGISTNSQYYVSVQDLYTIKLHNNLNDANAGINTVSLTSYGLGNHSIKAFNKKSIISSIIVEDSGIDYENKKRTTVSSGINTSSGYVEIKNHGFETGEIVQYSTSGTEIGGLSNSTNYYVTKLDGNRFRLSTIGSGSVSKDFYFRTNQYLNLNSTGTGTHTFNYPPISVSIEGKIGIASTDVDFGAVVQPIFRGEIQSVHIENGGVGYGSSEIINFERNPIVEVKSGTDCKLIPVIVNGKIVEVIVNNPGKEYVSPPDLSIFTNLGQGTGAVLTPIVENGQVKSVKIVESGGGYDPNGTSILVSPAGSGAQLTAKIKKWTINLFERYFKNITDDDGFISYDSDSNYGLHYGHLYAPRKLRESVFSLSSDGETLYGKKDLVKVDNSEVSSEEHSPIIGWAYDGNPIYGPYGYQRKDGQNSPIVRLKSGYSLKENQTNRPNYPNRFFVEDYEYRNSNQDDVLDEHNGRFCVTPDFPNGVYAYFATIEDASSEDFNNYKKPVFPYIIGNKYKSKPNEFNFDKDSNQDDLNLNNTNWIRNTFNLNLLSDNSSYEYITLPNSLNQTVEVEYSSPGTIDGTEIFSGGLNYKVNDALRVNNEGTGGFGFSARVSRIGGKNVNNISVATTSLYNVEIYKSTDRKNLFVIENDSPHGFSNLDTVSISGLSTSTQLFDDNFYTIGVSRNSLSISNLSGLGTVGETGITTYISVFGDLSETKIKENDIYQINNEKVKILSIDRDSSRIRIVREVLSSIGSSHSYSNILYEVPRRFTILSNDKSGLNLTQNENKEIYFVPRESLGIGSQFGVGIGTTISFSNPGVGITQIFIPTKSIYLPDHKLNTGDMVTYSSNGGTGISVSNDGVNSFDLESDSNLYVAKISNDLIGVSTQKVGIGSTGGFVGVGTDTTILFFTGIGTGTYHSIATNYVNITGEVSKNVVTVSTAETHGLLNNDYAFVDVKSRISKSYTVKYDDCNRKLLIDPKEFSVSDVDSLNNTITIANHGFVDGQRVSFSSTETYGELVNNQSYYTVVYNQDKIKLATSYYDSKSFPPSTVGIASTANGILSLVNPPIDAYKNSTLIFDVSDSSLSYTLGSNTYSAFDFDFYQDENFKQIFDSTTESNIFEVRKVGKVGLDSDAKVYLSITDQTPTTLFYNLQPVFDSNQNPPIEKLQIITDSLVENNNKIIVSPSKYSGKHRIISVGATTFTYNVKEIPESLSYNTTNSIITYETDSTNAIGTVTKIDIKSKGQGYTSLPSFIRISSNNGNGAIVNLLSNTVGKIRKTKIENIGFDFPSDYTLKPNLIFPQILKVDPLYSLESIGISSVGRGYSAPPKLLLFDGKTEELLPEVELRYLPKESKVDILTNTYRLNNIDPIIIPTQNSNGVGISSISYNSVTGIVSLTLSVGFSTASSFPFSQGDKVLIENISVGVNTAGKGYNSSDYDYQLFTLTGIQTNLGGYAILSYNLKQYLTGTDFPGSFDSENSSGRIIPEKHFPQFNFTLKQNNFFKNEKVKYSDELDSIGYVESWDEKSGQLKVASRRILEEGKTLEGISSKTNSIIKSQLDFKSFINVGAYSDTADGWIDEVGILNKDTQRVQDSFYYQNFSYSLKSRVPYDTWSDAVGSLNHTAGFKKFSDYQLESTQISGISTDVISFVDSTVDIDGFVNLNCVTDFDLASENALYAGSNVFSDEITFSSRILTDYYESIGNRVLPIDDISSEFNSNARLTRFIDLHRFSLSDARAQKYVVYMKDRKLSRTRERQTTLVSLIHDNSRGYLNQYGRVETIIDLGYFDFVVDGEDGILRFYPTKYKVNDYDMSLLVYNIKDNFAGVGNTNIGNIVDLRTNTVFASTSTPETIVSIGYTYSSIKALIQVDAFDGRYQFNEINLIHDRTNIKFIEYGELTTNSGLGTYNAYIDGAILKIDFVPNVGIAATVSTAYIAISDQNYSGIGTIAIKNANSSAISTSISSSATPTETVIAEISDPYNGGYFIVQVSDTTNNRHQLSELVLTSNDVDSYITEYGNIETHSGLGTIGSIKTANTTQLTFTPLPNINTHVKVYSNTLTNFDITNFETQFNNRTVVSDFGIYYGTERDIKRSFELKHNGLPIFQRYFNGSDPSIVSVGSSTIRIEDHFFVTGEVVKYSTTNPLAPELVTEPISIASTDFGAGIGVTDKLPSTVYIIKVDNNNIKLARSVEDALKLIPEAIDITSVGIGTNHSFTSINQNARGLISIDNVIQSPIVSTSTTTSLSSDFDVFEDILYADSSTNLYIGDLIKIENEIMKIEFVSSGTIGVLRAELGTDLETHSIGSTITKIYGNYNIVNNTLNFSAPPYGNVPLSSPLNPPNERDWVGISTGSSFNGRIFMRSGITDSSNETYYKNYVYDDISSEFSGIGKTFTLKSDKNDVVDVYTENAIILINEIFQGPGQINDYILSESSGSTKIVFTGEETYNRSDINTLNLPSGGSLISVGSTQGFGYQPLVSAGGTAIVSIAGTISSISIGSSGSGYRTSIQTVTGLEEVVVRVGVGTSSTGTPNIEFIGTASVSNGSIVSVAITNPGVGYTSSNPPYVVFDSPISYSNIPLIYSSSSPSVGIGTEATIDIVVGNGSSVTTFELRNIGYGYRPGEILTIPITGTAGIPTTPNTTIREFQISVDEVFADKFSGWSIGEIQPLDSIEDQFDGSRRTFSLKYQSNIISIYAQKGSPLNVQDNLLVFINDILQVPGEGYIFRGGSKITFTDAPLPDSTCKILFYKGSGDDVDVVFRDIIETVKIGDELTLVNDKTIGQSLNLLEDPRTVYDILSIDTVETNPYYGPGNTTDTTLLRPLVWCRQTEDKIINEKEVNKDRPLYEPIIHPTTNIIQPVGVGSTVIYVENLVPFFNPLNENEVSVDFQKNITLISQESKVAASATAIVSSGGTITSIDIIDGGSGYNGAPTVTIQSPVGVGTTTTTATASISSGRVVSINITNSVSGYSSTNPPSVLVEPPSFETESNVVDSYSGDSGVIVGIGTTTLGADNQIIFDLFIPTDSIMRNTALVGTAKTISSIDVGDFFVVSNSNVGMATSKFGSIGIDDTTVGIATQFSDMIYQVNFAEDFYTSVPGVGNTYVRRIFSKVSGLSTITFDATDITFDSTVYKFDNLGLGDDSLYIGDVPSSHYVGNYSWGKIVLKSRSKSIEYTSYTEDGLVGITSSAIVKRTQSLRYSNYLI